MAEIDPTLIHLDAELARLERQLRREPTPDAAAAPLPAGVTEASRLAALAAAFALTPFEMDLLLLALAPAIDARFGRRFGELLDDPTQRRPTVGLALALLGVTGVARLQRLLHVGEQAPLLRFRLLELEGEPGAPSTPLVDRALVPDPTVTAWLLGSYQPPAALGPQVDLSVPDDDPADAALGAAVWPQLAAAMHGQSLPCFFGQDEESQTATARRIATGMQSPLLTVDLRAAARSGTPPATAVRLALRDARLTGAIAYLTGMDLCLNEKTILPEVQTALFAHGDVVITGGKTAWQPAGEDERRTILWQEFPLPSYAQRADLWRHFLAAQGAGQDGDAAINPAELAALPAGRSAMRSWPRVTERRRAALTHNSGATMCWPPRAPIPAPSWVNSRSGLCRAITGKTWCCVRTKSPVCRRSWRWCGGAVKCWMRGVWARS